MASLLSSHEEERKLNYKIAHDFFLNLVINDESKYLSKIQDEIEDRPYLKNILIDFYSHINEQPNFGEDTVFHVLVLLTDYHTLPANEIRQSSVGNLREYSAEELFDLHRDTRTRELDERIRSSLSNQPQPITPPRYFRSDTPMPPLPPQVPRSINRVLVFDSPSPPPAPSLSPPLKRRKIGGRKDKYLGKVQPIFLNKKKKKEGRSVWRWIVEKREDGRYLARTPKSGILIRDLYKKRDADYGPPSLLPKDIIFMNSYKKVTRSRVKKNKKKKTRKQSRKKRRKSKTKKRKLK